MATWSATSRGCLTGQWRGLATLELSACGNHLPYSPEQKRPFPGRRTSAILLAHGRADRYSATATWD